MAQGQQLVAPEDRAGLHPLLVPLARQAGGNGAPAVTCLLRWPEGSSARVRARLRSALLPELMKDAAACLQRGNEQPMSQQLPYTASVSYLFVSAAFASR